MPARSTNEDQNGIGYSVSKEQETFMKLIIIHGPPAAGKFTVGSAIARRTGFKLFHNHISIDFVKSVFDFGTPLFWRMNEVVRFAMIEEAAKQNLDVIHTFCYGFGVDDDHFARLIASAEDHGGEVHIVLLKCDDDERRLRIGSESRVRIGKLTDPDSVGRSELDLTSPFPGRETLIIDTTHSTVEDTARQIIDRFGLQRSSADLQTN